MNKVKKAKKFDLEDRLVGFAIMIMDITDKVFDTGAGIHIKAQIVRSGSNPTLLDGEAQGAESRRDFIHKLKILLKELRETRAGLKIIRLKPMTNNIELVDTAILECNELISIFVASIQTARKNLENESKN